MIPLPATDNEPGALAALRTANQHYRSVAWPEPYRRTKHWLRLGDARYLDWIQSESVHLIVTSPPYWILKPYVPGNPNQLGQFEHYEGFLSELDKVWKECARVLVPGGRVCCVIGDVCIPRRTGRHYIAPLHSEIQVRRPPGLDCLQPIIWHKISNAANESKGKAGRFYGKPYQPGGIIKNDIEYILFLRKFGYRSPTMTQKALSMLTRDELKTYFKPIWSDVPGTSTKAGHPAPYPAEIARRLITMFSFAGDIVLDPFAGSGTTTEAAIELGRNSISVDVEPAYVDMARDRILKAIRQHRERTDDATERLFLQL